MANVTVIGAQWGDEGKGKVIDILAIFATLFGTAASLGLGALQIGSGFEVVGWMEEAGVFLLVAIVAVLTLAFVASAVSGVAKGIQWLSNINMVLALILIIIAGLLAALSAARALRGATPSVSR